VASLPRALVRFFLAVAYRLNPWRRVLFAASMIALGLAWLGFALSLGVQGPFSLAPLLQGHSWLLVAATLFALLLVLELRDKLSLRAISRSRARSSRPAAFEPWDRDGVRIVTAMRPANTVGGDYFDVIELATVASRCGRRRGRQGHAGGAADGAAAGEPAHARLRGPARR